MKFIIPTKDFIHHQNKWIVFIIPPWIFITEKNIFFYEINFNPLWVKDVYIEVHQRPHHIWIVFFWYQTSQNVSFVSNDMKWLPIWKILEYLKKPTMCWTDEKLWNESYFMQFGFEFNLLQNKIQDAWSCEKRKKTQQRDKVSRNVKILFYEHPEKSKMNRFQNSTMNIYDWKN